MEDPAKGSAEGPAESFPVKIRGTCPRQNVFSEQHCPPPRKQRARTKIFLKIFMRALSVTGIITLIVSGRFSARKRSDPAAILTIGLSFRY